MLDRSSTSRNNHIFYTAARTMYTAHTDATSKTQTYREILPQIACLIENETNLTANFANISAVLKKAFGWLWVGFYIADYHNHTLVLGPFQGPVACTRIPYGRGVCGQAWQKDETMLVNDVHRHERHIACSPLARSEIVIPIRNQFHRIVAVLDIDAATVNCFDDVDAHYLGKLAETITRHHYGDTV